MGKGRRSMDKQTGIPRPPSAGWAAAGGVIGQDPSAAGVLIGFGQVTFADWPVVNF